jgi:hypothetical protein
MTPRSLTRNWPIGLVLLASIGVALAVNHGGWSFLSGHGVYPVRIELPPVKLPPSAQLLSLQTAEAKDAAADLQAAVILPEVGDPSVFAKAFANVNGEAAPSPAPAAPPSLDRVRFNLADPYGVKSGSIELRKAIRVDGAEAGSATIRVTDGATIAISREELGKLLAGAGHQDWAAALGSGSFVSFDRIRQAGISVRYDAATDRIVVSG